MTVSITWGLHVFGLNSISVVGFIPLSERRVAELLSNQQHPIGPMI